MDFSSFIYIPSEHVAHRAPQKSLCPIFTKAFSLFHSFVNVSEAGTRCHLLLHLAQNVSTWPHDKRQHVVAETLQHKEVELSLNLRHIFYSSETDMKCRCEDNMKSSKACGTTPGTRRAHNKCQFFSFLPSLKK